MNNVNDAQPSTARRILRRARSIFLKAVFLVWKWSIPYRNRNLPQDDVYAAIWRTELHETCIRSALHGVFPNIALDQLPVQEEHIRQLLRQRLPPTCDTQDKEGTVHKETHLEQRRMWEQEPEEAWPHIPEGIRHILAAANAKNMEDKLQLLSEEAYHPSQGFGAMLRHKSSISKTFRMWRLGFSAAVSRAERISANVFFLFLIFMTVYSTLR